MDRELEHYPNSFLPSEDRANETRPELFDPALKHFMHGYRHGEPIVDDIDVLLKWRRKRRLLLDELLTHVSDSGWKEHLILRGSLLLKAWFGEAAREPGDVDWVVRPASIQMADEWTGQLFQALSVAVTQEQLDVRAGVEIDCVRVDDIWTYDRVPGRRIVFHWRAADLPPGTLQMDFVFGEQLWTDPVVTPVPLSSGQAAPFLSASKELSLAWKILWLVTDMHPQGKDLYDAVLLAERVALPDELFNKALEAGRSNRTEWLSQVGSGNRYVEWEHLQLECPWVQGEEAAWWQRLLRALPR